MNSCKWRHHSKGHDFGNVAVVGPTRRSEVGKHDNVRERAQCEGGARDTIDGSIDFSSDNSFLEVRASI